jgi:hypothetical protein
MLHILGYPTDTYEAQANGKTNTNGIGKQEIEVHNR